MWYGRTQSKNRLTVQVLDVGSRMHHASDGEHHRRSPMRTTLDRLGGGLPRAPAGLRGHEVADNHLANGGPSVNGILFDAGRRCEQQLAANIVDHLLIGVMNRQRR